MIEIALKNINGKDVPAVTSLQVAEAFGKEHFNVLRDIETILLQVPENFRKLNFEVSEYTIQNPLTGGELPKPMYLLTKDAFTLLTRSLTSATLRPLSTRMPSAKESPRSLTGPGALRYQKVASSTDSVSAGASYLRKPQLTRRQYHVAVKCQAF